MRNAPNAPLPRIGPYELIDKVGEGGMAEVWLARREGIGGSTKSCALKLPLEKYTTDERFRKMFLSEARLALKLSHGNIVSVFDAGEADGRLYMALEWIDGVDLRDFAQRIHDLPMRFSMSVVCHIIGELLHALRYAHTFAIGGKSLGIVHRDISPQNVLLSSSGEVKLSDFGIARVIGEETSQMHVKGKMRYMAPEQFQGAPEQASDLYAVGTILHELIEGVRFRDGLESREDWMRALLTGDKPELRRTNVPEALVALHSGLLEPEPRDRIGTADAALMQLSQCGDWRNSTMELRKMYARYFNQNRRTGLTYADGMMPALPDSVGQVSGLDPTSGPQREADAPAAAPASAPASAPQQAEPEEGAPVFFRRGNRRGRSPSEPAAAATKSELSGSTPTAGSRPAPAAGSVAGLQAPSAPNPQAAAPQPVSRLPELGPKPGADPYAATSSQSGQAAAASDPTRPGVPEETRPMLGSEEATTTSLSVKRERTQRRVRGAMLGALGIGVIAAGVGFANLMLSDGDDVETPVAKVPKASVQSSKKAPEPASEPQLDKAVSPVIPKPAPKPAEGEASAADGAAKPATNADPAGPTVLVKLRLETLQKAWIKVGSREILVDPRADAQLPVGEHPIQWKSKASDKWQSAPTLVLKANNEHIVKIGPSGLSVTAYEP